MSLEKLIDAVKSISNDSDIAVIIKTYELTEEKRGESLDQILGVYKGVVDGKSITLTHRWYDRCKTFVIQPDGNKVALDVDNKKVAEGTFFEDR